jgi:hypothetical protein
VVGWMPPMQYPPHLDVTLLTNRKFNQIKNKNLCNEEKGAKPSTSRYLTRKPKKKQPN